MVDASHYVVLSAALFAVGLACVIIRRNVLVMLMAVELMVNAVNLNLISFSNLHGNLTGFVFVLFVIGVESAVWSWLHVTVWAVYASSVTFALVSLALLTPNIHPLAQHVSCRVSAFVCISLWNATKVFAYAFLAEKIRGHFKMKDGMARFISQKSPYFHGPFRSGVEGPVNEFDDLRGVAENVHQFFFNLVGIFPGNPAVY